MFVHPDLFYNNLGTIRRAYNLIAKIMTPAIPSNSLGRPFSKAIVGQTRNDMFDGESGVIFRDFSLGLVY